MAGMTVGMQSRGQLVAIAQVRWHIFVHSLRTTKGALELFSRIVIGVIITGGGVGGAVLLGVGAWYLVSHGKADGLLLLLWPVFMFWQFFPVMATALTETMDSSELLRFPLNYRAYVLVRLVYGALDPATVLGSLWLIGITMGIGWARPTLLAWAALVLGVFGVVNMLLTQMVFAWIERWLAQRRTREIFAVLFFLLIISFQLIGPLLSRYGDQSNATFHQAGRVAGPVQAVLPPGIAASAIASAVNGRQTAALLLLLGLSLYGVGFLRVLSVRLHAQYRGENLSEVDRSERLARAERVRAGWELLGLPGPVAAVVEKEFRYLSRSGPVLLTFVTPIVMLFVFGLGGRSGPGSGFLQHWPELALPVGAGYALLLLTNLIYNNFGPDGGGIQFYLTSPASFRSVMLGKNIAHLGVLAAEVVVLWLGASLLYRIPSAGAVLLTLAGLLFAAPMNLAAGNLLSLYSPKKTEFGTFGRQRASQVTVLASFVIQGVVFGIAGLAIFAARSYGSLLMAVAMFVGLGAVATAVYFFVLGQVDRLALRRREVLTTELCK
jgi:ABC-2 type transport system permease protein